MKLMRNAAIFTILVMTILVVTGMARGQAAPATPTLKPARATAVGDQVCQILEIPGVEARGKRFIKWAAAGKIKSSGAIASVVFGAVSFACPTLVDESVDAVGLLLSQSAAKTPVSPLKLDLDLAYQPSNSRARVAALLKSDGWNYSASNVAFLANALCDTVARRQDPAQTVMVKYFPQATISSSRSINALVGETWSCMPGPGIVNTLNLGNAVNGYLVANTVTRDLAPPIVTYINPTGTTLVSGRIRLRITATIHDESRTDTYAVAVRYPTTNWVALGTYAFQDAAFGEISPGNQYQIAVRARDQHGNWSGWYFSGWFQS